MINLQWTEPQDTKPKRHPALYSRPQESIKPRLALASKVSYTEPSDLLNAMIGDLHPHLTKAKDIAGSPYSEDLAHLCMDCASIWIGRVLLQWHTRTHRNSIATALPRAWRSGGPKLWQTNLLAQAGQPTFCAKPPLTRARLSGARKGADQI